MSSIWNYLKKNASVLKLNFLKIEFQFKTRFLDNQVIVNWKLKKIKKKIVEHEFLENIQVELEFYELEF